MSGSNADPPRGQFAMHMKKGTHVDILIDRLNNRRPESFWPLHTRLEAEYEELIPLK